MRVRLFIWLILCIVCLHTPLSAQSPLETPSSMVLAATQAADGDSILLVKRRWQARVQTNVGDHLATLGIATLDRLSYNYPDAERRYAALATATDVSGTIRAYAILGDALAADTRGLLARADSLFPQARSAARLAGDSLVEAEALLGWAFSRAPVAGIAAGFALLDSASKLIPDSARGLRAEYLMRRGALRAVTAQGGGEDDARMSRNIARQIGAARLEARAIRTLALDAKLRGNDLRAIALLDTAAAIQRRVHDRSGLAETLLRQRESYIARMDLGKVKQLSFEAAEEARISYNAIAFRSVLLGLGTLSLYLRDYPSADAYLSRVIDLCRAEEDTTMMMLARSQRVDLYLSVGDVARALEEKNAVLNYHHNFGDRSEEFETLRELIAIHLQSGDIASATQTLQRAEQLARRQPRWLATLHFDRGAIALARKDWRAADQHFAGALAELDSTEHLQRYVVRSHRAEVLARQGDIGAAQRELSSADSELDRWRSGLMDSDLRKMVFQASGRSYITQATSIASTIALLALQDSNGTRGGVATALVLAQRHRARELTDRVLRAAAIRASISSPSDTARRNTNISDPAAVPTGIFSVSARMDSTPRKQALGDEWRTVIPDRRTAVLHYLTGIFGTPTTLFIVARDADQHLQIHARQLPPANLLAPTIARMVALLESGATPDRLSRILGEQLLDPALEVLDSAVTTLIIIPHGPLHRVPFDALRLPNREYVVTRFAVSVAPSVEAVAALRNRSSTYAAARPVQLLVFGNPSLAWSAVPAPNSGVNESDSVFPALEAFQPLERSVRDLPPLRGAAREAARIARFADYADIRLGTDASAIALATAQLDQYRILHFATHAVVDDRSDARTALALSAGRGGNGFVSPGDIAALHLSADLVVLSACRSGGGVAVDGEGVQGLTAAFLEAGAQSVVASYWRIADEPIVPIMEKFYEGLANGKSVAEALRAAKLDAIARGAPPRDWAALTLVGDPEVIIPMRHPARIFGWWTPLLGGLLLVAIAGCLTLWGRRRRKAMRGKP